MIGLLLFGLAALSFSSVVPVAEVISPETEKLPAKNGCKNTPTSRQCWGDYDISTDYYNTVPNTGVTRHYNLEISNVTFAPDGVKRIGLLVNGQMPGPTIYADWGDWVVVNVKNNLQNNGTSIHWHGVPQAGTNQQDGVPSVTQCPIAPGATYTYKWRATYYGSSWYHSHFALQAWVGAFGGIVVNGPSSANYDYDMGPVVLQDWSHLNADQLYYQGMYNGDMQIWLSTSLDQGLTLEGVTQDTGLINGMNTWKGKGKNFTTTVNPGKSYRIRLINGAIDTHFKFSVDNHMMTVMATDFVPIKPFNSTYVTIGPGQRYDAVIHANRHPGNYWMRAIPQDECSNNRNFQGIRGIMRYNGSSKTIPTSTPHKLGDACEDFPMASLTPYLDHDAGQADRTRHLHMAVKNYTDTLYKWYLGGTTMQVYWNNPSLLQLYRNRGKMDWTNSSAVIEAPKANVWKFLAMTADLAVSHPMHLHGHDFYILAQGRGPFNSSIPLQTKNPPRRDTATLPQNGYLVIGFLTDNPGAWLMHCHLGFHQSSGLSLQIIERQSEIKIDHQALNSTCKAWDAYVKTHHVEEDDSGI